MVAIFIGITALVVYFCIHFFKRYEEAQRFKRKITVRCALKLKELVNNVNSKNEDGQQKSFDPSILLDYMELYTKHCTTRYWLSFKSLTIGDWFNKKERTLLTVKIQDPNVRSIKNLQD